MAQNAPRIKELKKKTIIDRLKASAIFILLMIILAITGVIMFVVWLSTLLKGEIEGKAIYMNNTFYGFVGITLFFVVFFTLSYYYQRAAHGPRS